MKRMMLAAAVALMFGTGAAYAQSGQGGYLGENVQSRIALEYLMLQAPTAVGSAR